ncbi:MAG: hypothetical protein LiPW41_519 [Parcubacteria group bacterium LiPW_41]|nr:MAG: hypothetical protein LiPW41_519 [Parcubacteria group bacterium LiPW_41]
MKKKGKDWMLIITAGSWIVVFILFLICTLFKQPFESWEFELSVIGLQVEPISRWWDLLLLPAHIFVLYFGVKIIDKIKNDPGTIAVAFSLLFFFVTLVAGLGVGFLPAIVLASVASIVISFAILLATLFISIFFRRA